MALLKIKAEDLIFSEEIEDDRTNTFVQLNDYDWMCYTIRTRFKTAEQGTLDVCFEYCGCTISFMKVCQIYDGKKIKYEYRYDTDFFKKYIIQFLSQHIDAWDSEYAFNGEDIVIAFFNKVIEEGSVEKTKEEIEIL